MIYLLDTNAFSDLIREHSNVEARLAAATSASHRVVTSVAVRGEVLFGLGRLPDGNKRHNLEARAAQFFMTIPCEAIPSDAADVYARLKLDTMGRGKQLGDNDLWIAATAVHLGATLVTRDVDFSAVPGLTAEDWTA